MNKRKKHGLRIAICFLVLLVIIGTAFGICTHLALQDNNRDLYSYETDDTLLYTALKGAVLGEAFSLTENQVNTYINDEILQNNQNNIKNLRLFFHNDFTEIYSRIRYLNHDFALSAKALLTLDTVSNTVAVQLYDAKLGELTIPDFILKNIIDQCVSQTDNVSVKNGLVYVRSSFDFDINSFILNLTFQKFSIGDGSVTCQTNSLAKEALSALAEALKTSEGRQRLGELFHAAFSLDDLKRFQLDKIEDLLPDRNDLREIKDHILSRFFENA